MFVLDRGAAVVLTAHPVLVLQKGLSPNLGGGRELRPQGTGAKGLPAMTGGTWSEADVREIERVHMRVAVAEWLPVYPLAFEIRDVALAALDIALNGKESA